MNRFLQHLEITFRRDPTNYRPRINKVGISFPFPELTRTLHAFTRLTIVQRIV